MRYVVQTRYDDERDVEKGGRERERERERKQSERTARRCTGETGGVAAP